MASVRLLGGLSVADGGPRQALPVDKRSCLLAYLAYHGDWVGRERLAFLFWPDSDEADARRNLRQLLSRARQLPSGGSLELEPSRVRWPVATDVARFRWALGRQAWSEAVALYRGELLHGFDVGDAEGFGAWLELEREALRGAYLQAVLEHASALEAEGHFGEAAEQLGRLLAGDDLAEDVLQRYLRAAYLAGQREAALKAYERFAAHLHDELGLTPLEPTEQLVAAIRGLKPLTALAGVKARPAIPLSVERPPRVIGREREARDALAAETPLVVMVGEAGVGKSRLMGELAPSALVLRAQEGLQGVPYQPVVSLLRARLQQGEALPGLGGYLEDLSRLVPEVAPHLTPGPLEAQTAKSRLLEALARAFTGFAPSSERFQLVADDLQWCDASTLELLTYLALQRGLRVLGAYRVHEVSAPLEAALHAWRSSHLVTCVPLEPLTEAAMRELLASLIGTTEGPPLFSRWLHRGTGGNPMFALETLKALFEAGVLRADASGWHSSLDEVTRDYSELEVPPAVAEVIGRRVRRLSAEAQRTLHLASVVQEGFAPRLLEAISGLSAWGVADALEELEAAGLVAGERFRHDLVRQSVYHAVPAARRRLLHARVAEAFAESGQPALVAEHYLAAGEVVQAAQRWREAAERLRDRGLFTEAEAVLRRALAYVADEGIRWALKADLASVRRGMAQHEASEVLVGEVLASCDDPRVRAMALDTRAGNYLIQGKLAEAEQVVAEGLRLARRLGDVGLERSFLNLCVQLAFYRGDWEEARRLAEPQVAELRDRGTPLELCSALTNLGSIYDSLGRREEALALHHEALALAKRIDARFQQVNVAVNLLYCYMDLGRAEEGLSVAEEALELGRYEASDALRNNLAVALFELGRFEEAARHYETLVAACSDPTMLCIAWARLGELYQRLGHADGAVQALKQALAEAHKTDFAIARARVAINVCRFGSEEQRASIGELLRHVETASLPGYIQEELTQALAARGA